MWRSERRKWKRVSWSGQSGREIDSSSETKSRTVWEALHVRKRDSMQKIWLIGAESTVYGFP